MEWDRNILYDIVYKISVMCVCVCEYSTLLWCKISVLYCVNFETTKFKRYIFLFSLHCNRQMAIYGYQYYYFIKYIRFALFVHWCTVYTQYSIANFCCCCRFKLGNIFCNLGALTWAEQKDSKIVAEKV